MAVFLDEPLPDEALFSVIARYLRDGRVKPHRDFLKALMGPGFVLTVGAANCLAWLAAETAISWGMSAQEIRDTLTLYPYFAAFSGTNEGEAGGGDILLVSRRANSSGPGRLGLRHCDLCWESDTATGNPLYWRRAHQLPGVITCVIHRHPLSFSGSGTSLRLLETAQQFAVGLRLAVSGSAVQLDAHYRFALLSTDLLNGPRHLRALPGHANRFDCARAVGYRAGESVDVARMFKDLTVMFGTGYLREIGIPLHTDAWLRRAFFGTADSKYCPARTMLLDFLLRDRVNRMVDSGGPICPGSSCRHDQEHRLVVKGWEEGLDHYFCSCGLSFLYGRNSATGAFELLPTQDGHDISLAAVILGNRGRSQAWIAGILGLDADYTCRLLTRSAEVRPWRRRTERARHLAAWMELVDRCGDADTALTKDYRLWLSLGRLARSLPGSITPTKGLAMIRSRPVRGES